VGIIIAIIDANLWLFVGTLGFIAAMAPLGMLPVVAQKMSQRPRPKRFPARIILDRAIGRLGISAIVAASMSWWSLIDIGRIVSEGVVNLAIASFFLFDAYRYLRLWRKLMWSDQLSSGMDAGFQDGHT
jgi:hypothetical protein